MGVFSAAVRHSRGLRSRWTGFNRNSSTLLHQATNPPSLRQYKPYSEVLYPCLPPNDAIEFRCLPRTSSSLTDTESNDITKWHLREGPAFKTLAHCAVPEQSVFSKFTSSQLAVCTGPRRMTDLYPIMSWSCLQGHASRSFFSNSCPTAAGTPHSRKSQSSVAVTPRHNPTSRLPISRTQSNLPSGGTVYGGPKDVQQAKAVTLRHLNEKYVKKEPITMVTAYDYPSAVHVDRVREGNRFARQVKTLKWLCIPSQIDVVLSLPSLSDAS